MGADFGVVGFGHPKRVHRLNRDTRALKDFRREGVRGGDVGREAVAFVEPGGLAKFPQNGVPGCHFGADQFTHSSDCLLYTFDAADE